MEDSKKWMKNVPPRWMVCSCCLLVSEVLSGSSEI